VSGKGQGQRCGGKGVWEGGRCVGGAVWGKGVGKGKGGSGVWGKAKGRGWGQHQLPMARRMCVEGKCKGNHPLWGVCGGKGVEVCVNGMYEPNLSGQQQVRSRTSSASRQAAECAGSRTRQPG